MYCPKCSAEINSDETRFCSKCGFTIKSVRNILKNNGESESEITPLQKGLRTGVKLLLLALVLIPVFQILSGFFPPDDRLVESSPSSTWFDFLGNAILFALTLSGISRIFYAFLFERGVKTSDAESKKTVHQINAEEKNALPPQNDIPVSDFGKWKTTDELFEPIFSKPKTSGELK